MAEHKCPLCEAGVPVVKREPGRSFRLYDQKTGKVLYWFLTEKTIKRIEDAAGIKLNCERDFIILNKEGEYVFQSKDHKDLPEVRQEREDNRRNHSNNGRS